jgi:hypothetical protein
MQRRGRHHADAKAALLAARGATRRFKCTVILRDHCTGAIEENASGLGQFDAARLAAKELDAELGFDRLDPLAERRLLHAEPLGGSCDVAVLGNGHELTEVPQLYCHTETNMNFA